MKICDECKVDKLKQIGVQMRIGIGFECVGKCDVCKKNNNYLYSYEELGLSEETNA